MWGRRKVVRECSKEERVGEVKLFGRSRGIKQGLHGSKKKKVVYEFSEPPG